MKRIILSAATAALFMASCTAQDNTRMISQDDFVRTAEQTVNGVVSVKSYATPQVRQQGYDNYSNDPLLEFFFGQPRQRQSPRRQQEQPRQQQLGLGSGEIGRASCRERVCQYV